MIPNLKVIDKTAIIKASSYWHTNQSRDQTIEYIDPD